jgi:hypothetical protein
MTTSPSETDRGRLWNDFYRWGCQGARDRCADRVDIRRSGCSRGGGVRLELRGCGKFEPWQRASVVRVGS